MWARWLAAWVALSATGLTAPPSPAVTVSGRAMGTTWTVKFIQPAVPLEVERVGREAGECLEHLEQIFSTYRRDSELSRFNAADRTDWMPVAPELAKVAEASRRISEFTGGAFDVTVHPLVRLWGFGAQRRAGARPTAAEIRAARTFVDWRQLEVRLDPPALRKGRAGLAADFSSMAKGFAADAVSDLLARLGAPNHLVQVGGDLRSGGALLEGGGWRAAVEEPRAAADRRSIACVVTLREEALSTSGDYRNFFEAGGRRYGHIIDPRSGEPPLHGLTAVSVVQPSCAASSAWATALFVLGQERGFEVARQHRLAAVFFVRRGDSFEQRRTPEFETRMSESPP